MASNYARRMARLSARIFGEVYKPTTIKSMKVYKLMRKEPIYLEKRVIDYYPPHIETAKLMMYLRQIGLYRDEHLDFRDEMKRVARLRGKGKPKKGEGKRALKRAKSVT